MQPYFKAIIIVILLCLTTLNCFAQGKDNFSIGVRGKASGIAFFILEDQNIRTGTVGVELTYKNRHSLGVDLTYWKSWYQRDVPDPIPLYNGIDKRTFLYVDYKLQMFTYKDINFYINAYYKNGKYKSWYERYWENDSSNIDLRFTNSTINGSFNDFGLGVGMRHLFGDNERFGIDLSINAAVRYEINDKITYDEAFYEELYNVKEKSNLPFIKLNLFFVIKKSSG